MRLILLVILLTNSAFAQNSTTLNKGDIAPFSGILIKKERVVELIKAEKKVLVLSDLRIHQEELIDYHKQDARIQRRKLSEAKFSSYMTGLGMLVLGVVVTALTFKINQKVGEM